LDALEQKMGRKKLIRLNVLQYNPIKLDFLNDNYSLDSLISNAEFDDLCKKYKEKFSYSKLKTFSFSKEGFLGLFLELRGKIAVSVGECEALINGAKLYESLGFEIIWIDLNKDGKVNLKPMDIKYQDITVNVGGTHGFDQTMNYNLKFDVPVKYLGKDVTNLLAKLTPADQKQITSIPVNGLMTGNFSQPKFNSDLKQSTTNLTTQLVKMQKEKLVNQGTNALGNLIGGTKSNTATDTTKSTTTTPKEDIKTKATGALKDLFGGKKKKEE